MMDSFEQRLRRVRESATARERRRLLLVNDAYTRLSNALPQDFIGNGTKLDILRGAVKYITLLDLQLKKPEASEPKTQINQSYGTTDYDADSEMEIKSRSKGCCCIYSFDPYTEEPTEVGTQLGDRGIGICTIEHRTLIDLDDPPPKFNISWY
ncbi:myoblast determination protein 1 homolog B-like [Anneissia japonica]|uniref:myoblast determination protein 1 homolog B-like n=1 Tax=Anneissia japonica TaxID=1529436 RepID=UPI001425B8F7|nr:myoblast determination protein 1 homolog B-like [Anneissia japonica]